MSPVENAIEQLLGELVEETAAPLLDVPAVRVD